MQIAREFIDAMIQHAREDDPNECCGALAAKDGRVIAHFRIANATPSPYRYQFDPKEHMLTMHKIEDLGAVEVFYHSHTHSPARPSATDIRLAENWPGYYLLVSLMDKEHPDVRLYTIDLGSVSEEPITVVD